MIDVTTDLKDIASRLNEESDSLTADIQDIQGKLNRLNLGLDVWCERPILIEFRLGYCKTHEGWGLAVKKVQVRVDSGQEFGMTRPEPLLRASRQLRIAAVEELPNLIEVLEERAKFTLKAISRVRSPVRLEEK